MKSPRIFGVAILLFLVVVAGLLLGTFAGRVGKERKVRQLEDWKNQLTTQVLERMSSLRLGQRLGDHTFEDLTGLRVTLRSQIVRNTWIGIVDPECETCLEDLWNLKALVNDPEMFKHFFFISSANRHDVQALKATSGLSCAFLIDSNREWIDSMQINAFPFHLLVDEEMKVLDIAVGPLSTERIRLAVD